MSGLGLSGAEEGASNGLEMGCVGFDGASKGLLAGRATVFCPCVMSNGLCAGRALADVVCALGSWGSSSAVRLASSCDVSVS